MTLTTRKVAFGDGRVEHRVFVDGAPVGYVARRQSKWFPRTTGGAFSGPGSRTKHAAVLSVVDAVSGR